MFKVFWQIFKCHLYGINMSESVHTLQDKYTRTLWMNKEQRKKYIIVCWDFDDEHCPVNRWSTKDAKE